MKGIGLVCLASLLAMPALARAITAQAPLPQTKPAWQARFVATRQQARAHPPNLVFLGDSIVQELRNRQPEFGDINQVWRHDFACRGALNLGFSADTTGNALWRITHGALAGTAPKLVVVMIGTNDLSPRWNATPAATAAGVRAVVAAVHAAVPGAHILVLGLLPRQKRNRPRRQANRILARMPWATLGATYRDIGSVLGEHGLPNPAYYREANSYRPLLHPNAAGWALIAQAIAPDITSALGQGNCGKS